MPIAHILEDFSLQTASQESSKLMSDVAIEDQRLASFEQGFTAGWDDAIDAQSSDQTRMTGKLAQNLEDVSFTYHEALSQMLSSIEPVFQAITESIMPELLQETLVPLIVEKLSAMARLQAEQPVELVVPAGVGVALRPILTQEFSVPVLLREDPKLPEGQIQLRVGVSEQEVDSMELLEEIRTAVEAFEYTLKREIPYEQFS
ncbi:MAG: ABC transporter ATP-binding protein [Rhodobacteraceae bacterium]|nr:ABC transporter ATP-binding protein [Paracoccaceae bacterium]